jgi:hypothetical protein
MAKPFKPQLVAEPRPRPEPPVALGKIGRDLWNRIQAAYDVSDECGRELLAQACAAADRAESLRARINADGEVIATRQGMRGHPLISLELQARNLVGRLLHRLGLNFEPPRGPGNPGYGGIGITATDWKD